MPYPRPSITHGRQVPPFVLKLSGQRPAGVAFLPWLLVFMALVPHWCCFLGVVVVPPCAACRASTKSYGRRPSIYREGEPTEGWGNPEGVPRSQTARALKIFKVKKCARALRLGISGLNR